MSRELRIALVCVSLRAGGTERIVTRMANHLSKDHQVSLITLVSGTSFYPLDQGVIHHAPKLHRPAAKIMRLLSQAWHLLVSLRSTRPDVCLVFGEDIASAGCLLSRIAGVRSVIVLFRGTPQRALTGLNGLLNPLTLRLSSRIVVQTQAGRDALALRYRNARLAVIPNPIELPQAPDPVETRAQMIVNVGSMGRKKNQAALLRAFSQVPNRAGWQLFLVGDGPDRPALEKLAAKLDVRDQTRFLGQREDATKIMQQARIFAFTSLSEGFPNALAEAMAAGCAPISYDCPTGPSEMITHGKNGFLISNGNEAEFADHLAELMANEALQRRFGEAACAEMTRFDLALVMMTFEMLIQDAAARFPARARLS